MASSTENNNEELVKDLAKSLQITSTLMQSLLTEIRQNSTSLAVLKEKLEALKDNVDGRSSIVRNGKGTGSLVTRVALVEQSIKNIEETLDEFNKELNEEVLTVQEKEEKDREYNREQNINKLKVAAVAIPGVVSLILIIIKMFMGEGVE